MSSMVIDGAGRTVKRSVNYLANRWPHVSHSIGYDVLFDGWHLNLLAKWRCCTSHGKLVWLSACTLPK